MQIKHTITFLLILVLITQPVSANFLDDFLDKITGRVTEETTTETIVEEEPTPEPEPVQEEPIEEPTPEEPAIEEPICPPIPVSMWCSNCNIEVYGTKCLCPMKKDENECAVWDCDACETIEDPIRDSCGDSLDCPSGMKCENSICVDVGCVKEGESGPSAGINPIWFEHLPTECCEGLKSITYSRLYDENCRFTQLVGGPTGVCSKCGNGNCENWETKCNCPEDCGGEIEVPAEEPVEIELPPGCRRIILENGMEVIECEKECLNIPEIVVKRCQDSGGRVIERTDHFGCPFIECEYDVEPGKCPTPEELEARKKACLNQGLEPIIVRKGECDTIKCRRAEPEQRCAEDVEVKKEIKEKCEEAGGEIVKHFDNIGCPITTCITPELECAKDVPPEAHENCEMEEGDLMIKRDSKGCIVFVDCIRRGEREIPYEDIDEIPPVAKLLSVVLKLESLKIEFDKLARKVKSIANYYEGTGNAEEAEKFRKVASLFSSANDKIEDIKDKIRSKAGGITIEDLREIKHDIKYISETIMQDALYILLGGEINLEGSAGWTEEGYTNCGSDSRCWEEALRLCEPAVHTPSKPIEGIIAKIHGLDDDGFCIIEANAEGHSMLCKVLDYGISMSGKEEEILEYCEGSLVEWLKSGQKPGEIEKPKPGKCVDKCGDGICQAKVCMAKGCPCAETKESCPEDCAPSTLPFELCTLEDEKAFKECQNQGGNPQTDPSKYGNCEIYTNCKIPEVEGEVVFTDNFEEGTENWIFHGDEGYGSTVVVDGNTVLKLTGVVQPDLPREWNNYIFKFRFKRIDGSMHVNFRKTSPVGGQSRYIVSISKGVNNLIRHVNENWQRLDDTPFGFDENWHTLEIRGYDNLLNVYLDDELLYKYKDTESPLLFGRPGFEIHTGGEPITPEFLIDDVEIRISGEKDIKGGVQ